MKILFATSPIHPGTSTSSLLCTQLSKLAEQRGYEVAVYDNETGQGHWKAQPLSRLFSVCDEGKTIEESLYNAHVLRTSFLNKDYKALKQCIEAYKPDLIVDLGRPCASILAREENIPCTTLVDASMYKSRNFDSTCLNDLNRFLREHEQEQILRYTDLFTHATLRFGFGPISTQPFIEKEHVLQFSSMCLHQDVEPAPNRIVVFFEHPVQSAAHTKRMLTKAFKGAPYEVYATIHGIKDGTDANMHWLKDFRPECLNGARAVLHDGNAFLMNQAIVHGIPQVIVHDNHCTRNWNGAALTRNHCGLALYDKECTMQTLYETYRHLLSDDSYITNTKRLQAEALQLPPLEAFPFELSDQKDEAE